MGVDWNAYSAAKKYSEISYYPSGMIFSNQSHTVTEFNAFFFQPVSDAADRIEHLRICILRTFLADDLHSHFIGMRFGGIRYQLTKRISHRCSLTIESVLVK